MEKWKRIVIKVGTTTLTHKSGRLNIRRVEQLAKVICDIANSGIEFSCVVPQKNAFVLQFVMQCDFLSLHISLSLCFFCVSVSAVFLRVLTLVLE